MGDRIKKIFYEQYEETFTKAKPSWGEVKVIFDWINDEGIHAKFFEDVENLDDLRRETESHFSHVKKIRKKVEEESRKVNKELTKRYDNLRTKGEGTGVETPIFQVERKEQKFRPPK